MIHTHNNEIISKYYDQMNNNNNNNNWAVLLVRFSGPFLKWTRDELKQMDQRTRKLIAMHKALHPRDDVDRLYVSRKGGRKRTCHHQRQR